MERFIGGLIEHYGGAFPLWLAPEQARVMPISEKSNEYAKNVFNCLQRENLRCTIDAADDKINAKIKRAHDQKLPYMLVVGPAEQETNTVAVRIREQKQKCVVKVDEFICHARRKINEKALELALIL
jgi:threonyl-tRNA synthetase